VGVLSIPAQWLSVYVLQRGSLGGFWVCTCTYPIQDGCDLPIGVDDSRVPTELEDFAHDYDIALHIRIEERAGDAGCGNGLHWWLRRNSAVLMCDAIRRMVIVYIEERPAFQNGGV
jgi:hypothetical protein